MSTSDLLTILRQDYQRFPHDQTYAIYAEDVNFKDPMSQFSGLDRYRQMISLIERFFQDPTLELHALEQTNNQIRSDWTLTWTTPFPWRPKIVITGWSELTINESGLISTHTDYWHCSRWNVLQQHFFSA